MAALRLNRGFVEEKNIRSKIYIAGYRRVTFRI